MLRTSICALLVFGTASALAADMNLSGRYLDASGDPVVISQSGQSLSLIPNMKEMPEQARQFLGEIKLTGTIKTQGEDQFAMQATFRNTIEPIANMKLKMTVEFAANGSQSPEGLVMKACEWKAQMTVYSGGEIAGSEDLSEKCVGLWKKN
jgi:hypothetical protein